MPWMPAFDATFTNGAWWLWLAGSIVADLLLFACVAWLWRSLVRTRREARRRLAEARGDLTRRTEALRWATELAEVGVWSWDLATGLVEWTDRCKAQFALPQGRTPSVDYVFSVMHPEDRGRVRAAIDRSLADRQDYRAVFRVVHPDGTHHQIAALGRAAYAADGTPASMGGVTIDVTGLKKIEDELRGLRATTKEQAAELELARRFKLLAENASDVVMEMDNAGAIRWITPSVRLKIGRSPEGMIGERFARLAHPDDRERVRTLEEQVTRGVAAEARLRLRIADDGYHWFSVSLRPVFDDGQVIVGRVGGWRDVHHEVLAQEVVTAERHRLQATLEGMLDPIAIIEPVRDGERHVVDFNYLAVNPAACAWLRADRDRLLGTRMCASLPEVESSGLLRNLAELADTGRPLVLDDFPFTLRGVGLRRLDVRGIRGDEWITLVWRDISDRHEAMEKLAASEEQFRLLAENSTDVIVRIDPNDRIAWVSPSITPVLGWAAADCIGRDGREFLADADARAQYERDKARARAGQGAVARSQVRAATGKVHWMEVRTFPYRTSARVVSGIVASMHVVDVEVQMEQDLDRRARIDELTGLPNRRELLERLAAVVARHEPSLGLLWCDIDGFKAINDAHGHAAGDAVLETLSRRIRGCLRSTADLGGRIGGDELVVVLPGIEGLDAASAFAENLRRLAAEPIPAADGAIRATISVGVTLAGPDECVDAFLARADDAMYRAKEGGKNRVVAIPPPAVVLAGSR